LNKIERPCHESFPSHPPQVTFLVLADGDGVCGFLLLTDDEHIRHLLQLPVPYFVSHFFVTLVELNPNTGCLELVVHFRRILKILIGDRQDSGLHRREPEGKLARKMFDENADESLQRAEWSSVNHYRAMLLAVCSGVFEIEAFRHDIVNLHCSELPGSSKDITHHEINLRAVECRLAHSDVVIQLRFVGCLFDILLSLYPERILSAVLFLVLRIPEGEPRLEIAESQRVEDKLNEINDAEELLFQLILPQKHVRVILGETTNPDESVQFT